MWLLEEMESITELGDLHAMDFAKNANDVRKLHQEIKKKEWDVSLVDSSQGIDTEERDFGKLQVSPQNGLYSINFLILVTALVLPDP